LMLIAGVDIGNSTTEVCIAQVKGEQRIEFLSSASRMTTGTKGTVENVAGIRAALEDAMLILHLPVSALQVIRINEATPVIGATAMETISETIITESSMIGHDPSTPAGFGQAAGTLLSIENLKEGKAATPYIVTATEEYTYEEIAGLLNQAEEKIDVVGLILQADEAVLVWNRLNKKIPVVDEVRYLKAIPENKRAAIEVAMAGQSIRMLSNPYGIATLFHLSGEETKQVTPIAKSLIGKRSAVIVQTPHGKVKETILPAGELYIRSDRIHTVPIDAGAEKIMEVMRSAGEIHDISGQEDTNIGRMLSQIKSGMGTLTGETNDMIEIKDILAVDTFASVPVSGALAGETCMEKAVGIAAMVKTRQLPMQRIAQELQNQLGVSVQVAGVEAVMATLGALTTPGTMLPIAILDLGGGSTDAAILDEAGKVTYIHQAGAGELVSMLIQTELGLKSRTTAELIKRHPLAKVESLFHMRLENGAMRFLNEPMEPKYFGSVILLQPEGFIKIEEDLPMEKIALVRREAKRKVFVTNTIRALSAIAKDNNLRNLSNIVLVGGSAEDYEIPEMLMEEFANYKIVCGRGNIRASEGPRNAVATGLVLSFLEEGIHRTAGGISADR